MAPLLNMSAWVFSRRLDIIHQAFVAARRALDAAFAEQQDSLKEYLEEVANGLDAIEEHDEDGHLLWSQDQVLRMRIEDAAEALQSLSKATVISAYHIWEDAARNFTGRGQNAKHAALVEALAKRGVEAHSDLDWITRLVNTLKHGNAVKGRELHELKPDLFHPAFNPNENHIAWYDAIVISPDTVELVIERLGRSGPTTVR